VPARISSHLVPSPVTRLVAFTGSTVVGRHLTMMAAEHSTPVLMELGGHAPVIVSRHTDVAAAASSSASRKTRNAGQVCTSPTRFFVHRAVFDEFLAGMTAGIAATVVGDGREPATTMGPLAHDRRVAALGALVDDAVAAGARLVAGGGRIDRPGYFFAPTVLAHVPPTARVMQEEPFGPLAIVNPVDDLDEAIAAANAVPYGLAAYAFSDRADEVDLLTDGIEAGNLSINTLEASLPETPFGGVKASGYGREGGAEGILHYMVTKHVSHSMRIV
jgi:succinate-semialdehyde dehydrogenase/glutarate-semialdehyde dehydrogenase